MIRTLLMVYDNIDHRANELTALMAAFLNLSCDMGVVKFLITWGVDVN